MFPLDAIYGPFTYRRFDQDKMFKGGLKSTLQSSREVDADRPLAAGTYTELVDIVSFLSIMNKRHTLYFRGQASNWPLRPTAFRPIWTSLSGTRHSIPNDPAVLQEIWDHLNGPISSIVLSACDGLPMPRPATLGMFREAVWAVAALRTMAHSFDRYNTEPSRSCKLCALGRTAQRLSVCCRVATQHQLGHLRRGSARRAGPSPGCLSTRGKAPALPGWLLGGALSLYESQSKSNRQRPGQCIGPCPSSCRSYRACGH